LQSDHVWNDDNKLGTIIGVAKDFNYNSLHNKIGSLALVVHPEWGYEEISIRIDGTNVEQALAEIKETWDKTISSYPFNYSFLDDHFNSLYRSDSQMRWALSAVAGCAILIACIGLFGLAANLALTKVKEIGIRKTLGASSMQITVSMTSHFIKLVAASFVLACPITYYLISIWLESFSYRIEIGGLTFIVGGLIATTIAVLTIGYHTVKSGFESPVKSLRYE
jgi:putative ABC transport system permease protein